MIKSIISIFSEI